MERLLNIREAAEILNVSRMTLRRWTNTGQLRCYRVGGKRERRFRIQDLKKYLEAGTAPAASIKASLGFGGFSVPDGSHVAHLGVDDRDTLDIGASYLSEGLARGETVLLVASTGMTEKFMDAVRERGHDVRKLREKNRLFSNQGMDSPVDQAEHIAELASKSGKRFRVLGEMRWAKGKGWSVNTLRELEEIVNTSLNSDGNLFLCQYFLESFSGQEAMMAVETHSHTIFRQELKESPYYRRPL
jgi:transcriptional repressor of dcmA and dcmR